MHSQNITETALIEVLKYSPKLIYLNLQGQKCVQNGTINIIASFLPHLRFLNIQDIASGIYGGLGYDQQCFENLLKSCKNLEELHIDGDYQNKFNTLDLISKYCPQLKSIEEENSYSEPQSWIRLAQNCTKLSNIRSSTSNVNDKTIFAFASHLSDTLQNLNVRGADISDEAMVQLVSRCSNLKSLSLPCVMSSISDKTLVAIGKYCKFLESLDLSYNRDIKDKGLSSILLCQNLQHLNINNLTNVTDKSFLSISENFIQLKTLRVHEVPQLTDNGYFYFDFITL